MQIGFEEDLGLWVSEFPVTNPLPEPILTQPPANLSFPFVLHFKAYHNQLLSPQWYQVPP